MCNQTVFLGWDGNIEMLSFYMLSVHLQPLLSTLLMINTCYICPCVFQGPRASGKVHNFGKREQAIKRNPNVPVVVRGWLYKQVRTHTLIYIYSYTRIRTHSDRNYNYACKVTIFTGLIPKLRH